MSPFLLLNFKIFYTEALNMLLSTSPSRLHIYSKSRTLLRCTHSPKPALTLFLVTDERLEGYGRLHLDRHLFVLDEVLLDQLHGVSQHQLVVESQRAETVQHPAGLADTEAERKEGISDRWTKSQSHDALQPNARSVQVRKFGSPWHAGKPWENSAEGRRSFAASSPSALGTSVSVGRDA